METNCRSTDATIEHTPNNCVGTLEFWDGHLAFLWIDLSFKQFGILDGHKRKQRSSEDTRVVLRKR